DNSTLHNNAESRLKGLATKLTEAEQKEVADKLTARLREAQRRDLEITLVWEGGERDVKTAGLDLKVEEPSGSVCSWRQRQTVGGGTLLGGGLGDRKETYVVAQAFPGEYKVTVERVWGKPQGNKCQLRVVRHKGTADQTEDILTVDLASTEPVKVKLEG